MSARKSGTAFGPPIIDDLSEIPTLPEIERVDNILGAIVDQLIGRETHTARMQANAQSGKAGKPARSKTRTLSHGG
jgi:hypothetical protein